MPSMLQFPYGREISDRSIGAEPPEDFNETPEGFSVSWVVHRHETLPLAVEHCVRGDLDQIVETCRARLSEMRDKHSGTPPDGFLVFNRAGGEVRRWFECPRPTVQAHARH
jgi:hypothetical protein